MGGGGNDGCTAWGCRVSEHYSNSKFHMKIEHDTSGAWTVTRDGNVLSGYQPDPSGAWDYIKQMHQERGQVLYSSEWVGWVPVDDCGTDAGDLYGSSFTISNLVISGSVVQGPEPAECATPPAPPPTPPAKVYCPTADDLTIAYCDGGYGTGCPMLADGGWTINGGGGVASKSAFNLLGGYVEFDIDLSNVETGVNANIYTIAPASFSGSAFNKTLDYCDGAASGSDWCMELDWIEANGHCGGATTIHTIEGPGNDGCTAWGCRVSEHYGNSKFHMRIEHDASGAWKITRDGQVLGGWNPAPDNRAWDYVKQMHT